MSDHRIDACRALLERSCRDAGHFVTGDGRVGEDTAAQLLGLAQGTLANQRGEGRAPPHYRIGGGGYKVTYRLDDLAAWIELGRVDSEIAPCNPTKSHAGPW